MSFATPIVLVAFNRPDTTARVLDELRRLQPRELFLVCDGPRSAEDKEGCESVRRLLETVDWKCTVHKDYSETNLGLRQRIETGLTTVFNSVERAIILEDDCVAHPDFFEFCQTLLERYADDSTVGLIGGDNAHGWRPADSSCYFSRYTMIWGWATWARAWKCYDKGQSMWPAARDSHYLYWLFGSSRATSYWSKVLQDNYEGGNSWARVWLLSNWLHQMSCALPRENLISNIGFGEDATHTKGPNPIRAFPSTSGLQRPFRLPDSTSPTDEADALIDKIVFSRDKDIFAHASGGTGPRHEAVALHNAFHASGLSHNATNEVLAAYFREKAKRSSCPWHLKTSEDRGQFLGTLQARADDYSISAVVRAEIHGLLSPRESKGELQRRGSQQ